MRQSWLKVFFVSLSMVLAGTAYSQVEYHDEPSGVLLSLPPGWTWAGPKPLGDRKSVLTLKQPETVQTLLLYVQILDPAEEVMPAEKMSHRLLKQAEAKVRQRTREGYENYRLRENSRILKSINGRSALSWVDDYTVRGNHMVEYLTRVRNEKTNALFYARLPADQLDDFKMRVDPIIETLEIQ
jgi:hypothetical protein